MDAVCLSVVRTLVANQEMLSEYATALLARAYLAVVLFSGNQQLNSRSLLQNLQQANYDGYAPIPVTSFFGPSIDQGGNVYLTVPQVYFTHGGGPAQNTIYGAGLVAEIVGTTRATGTATQTGGAITTVAVTGGGSGYTFAPNVRVIDGAGYTPITDAVVTATVVGGIVTALNIITPGAGYVNPTLVIDPPLELIACANTPNPIPMAQSTDALPISLQVTLDVNE